MQRIKMMVSMALLTTAALVAGCNVSASGAEGNVLFTPDECGRYTGCDFEDSVGVGGTLHVHISGLDGFSTAGVTLDSDAPEVLTVEPLADVSGRPTWQLYGVSPGVARLLALDQDGYEVDLLEVAVQELSGLILQNVLGNAVGPTYDTEYDEHWIANADERVVFDVTPVIGENVPTMGVYEYTPYIEDEEFDAYIGDVYGLDQGRLDFTAPAGQYGVIFENKAGHSLSVLIDVQPAGSN